MKGDFLRGGKLKNKKACESLREFSRACWRGTAEAWRGPGPACAGALRDGWRFERGYGQERKKECAMNGMQERMHTN